MKKLLSLCVLVCDVMLGQTIDSSQFTAESITAAMVRSLHQLADLHNANAVKNYNLAVDAYNQAHPVNVALGLKDAPPVPPMLEVVNDDQVAAAEVDFQNPGKYQIFTFKQYVPPTPAQVSTPVPVDLVGDAQGNGFYGCVNGDTSPDGSKFFNGRGLFLKHLFLTLFGKSCAWTLIQAAQ